jgi:DnaJ-class molecular chaperone
MNPGDEAEAGTPGTGESVCPICHGTGRILDEDDTVPCSNCGGSGVVIEGIGGG